MTETANPALYAAQARTPPVIVTADPADCSFQFNPTGTAKFTSPLRRRQGGCWPAPSVKYDGHRAGRRTSATVKIGGQAADRRPTIRDFAKKLCSGADGRRLPCRRQSRASSRSQIEPKDGLANFAKMFDIFDGADAHADRHSDHPGDLRDDGLRPDRGGAGRVLPDPHPLLRPVAAVSHRQRLVRRPAAGNLVRHGGADRRSSTSACGIRSWSR